MFLFLATTVNAATSVYYQFNGTGVAGTIADSSVNGLDGTAQKISTTATEAQPAYSTEVVAGQIRDGLGGMIVNTSNTGSIKFENTGVSSGLYNQSTGGQIRVSVNASNASVLQPVNFTAEAFIKAESNISFASLFGMSGGNGAISWQLDNNPSINDGTEPAATRMRYRADHQMQSNDPNFVAGGNNDSSLANVSGTNSDFGDGLWHHVAITYDESINQFRLYMDYVNVANGTLNSGGSQDLVYTQGTGSSFLFIGGGGGGRAFDGWIDEFRFSSGILDVDQFLYAVPEPGRAVLLTMGLSAFVMMRRKGARVRFA